MDAPIFLADWIRKRRAALHITQSDLAFQADVSLGCIARLESPGCATTAHWGTLAKLARVLGTPPIGDWLAHDAGTCRQRVPDLSAAARMTRARRSVVGQWITRELAQRGKSRQWLADQLGVTWWSVRDWCGRTGARPGKTNAQRLVEVLGAPPPDVAELTAFRK